MGIKVYKIRIYPTIKQQEMIWQHIGACRFIWNYMIDFQNRNYQAGGKYYKAFDMINLLKPLKEQPEYTWLNEVSFYSLSTICRDLHVAYDQFFKKTRNYPKFKSKKKSKSSFPIRGSRLYFKNGYAHIEKIGKVKYKTDYNLPQGRGDHHYLDARISYVQGKWILTVGMERENQTLQLTDKSMGIDLGIKELAVVAFGDEELHFPNINKSKKICDLNRQLLIIQRNLSRKYRVAKERTGTYEKSNNIKKLEQQLRQVYYKLYNIRQNYINQVTHQLIMLKPYRIVMEDLNVNQMLKNKHLARAVSDAKFSEFIRQMKYKCEWNGIEFIQADRWYPSSKTCSCCGRIKANLKLSDRIFECECGLKIDRDYNAALNLSRYAV